LTLLRRVLQATCLVLFLWFLAAVAQWGYSGDGADFFLHMDPALMGFSGLSGRAWQPAFWPSLLVLASALVMGRAFCGYVCPMGATLDGAQALFGPKKRPNRGNPGPVWLKYLVLAGLAGAALAGVGLVFWASPLALITRFYGLLIHPLVMLGGRDWPYLGKAPGRNRRSHQFDNDPD